MTIADELKYVRELLNKERELRISVQRQLSVLLETLSDVVPQKLATAPYTEEWPEGATDQSF